MKKRPLQDRIDEYHLQFGMPKDHIPIHPDDVKEAQKADIIDRYPVPYKILGSNSLERQGIPSTFGGM